MSYTRRHWQNGYQPQKDQTDDSDIKKDNQGRQDFKKGGDKKASCGYCGRKGKLNPQKTALNGEKDVESEERSIDLQWFANKKQQLNCTNQSIQRNNPAMSQHTLSKTKL